MKKFNTIDEIKFYGRSYISKAIPGTIKHSFNCTVDVKNI